MPPITPKVERQSRICPMILPSGNPKIIANELPSANNPKACCFLPMGATRMTKEAVMDQNTEWAKAIPAREINSTQKFHANAERIWLRIKRAKRKSNKRFLSILALNSIKGNEPRDTSHA
ncbi:hypothetical protein HpVa144_13940 [Helicobacter pylori]